MACSGKRHYAQKWDRESVKRTLLEYHAKGYDMRESVFITVDCSLANAARRYCGSWKQAMEYAGIPLSYKPPVRRTRESIQKELVALLERGENLSAISVMRNHPRLYAAACKLFEDYRRAVESLGLDYADFGQRIPWTRERVEKELSAHIRGKNPINSAWMVQHKPALHEAAIRHFGSWKGALERFGIAYDQIRKHREWTTEAIIEIIQEMDQNNEPLDYTSLKKIKKINLYEAGQTHFGTWGLALMAAGLDCNTIRRDRKGNGFVGIEEFFGRQRCRKSSLQE